MNTDQPDSGPRQSLTTRSKPHNDGEESIEMRSDSEDRFHRATHAAAKSAPQPTEGFKHLTPNVSPSVLAQKREDFDAMRAYQAVLLADFQQFLSVIQNSIAGIGFIFVSAAGARISGNLKPVIAFAIAIIVTTLFLGVAHSLFTSFREKILRDCEIYAGHRDRYLVQMKLLGLYEPHETGTYGSMASCLDQPFSVRAGKGTEQTLTLMKLIKTLATTFVVAGCLLTISVAFNDEIGRLWDRVAAQVKG